MSAHNEHALSLADVERSVSEASDSLRAEFLASVATLSLSQLIAATGHPRDLLLLWRDERRIFAIRDGVRELYPTFQFGPQGQPLPLIADVLAVLRRDPDRTDWDNALWFNGETGWLDGARPCERIQSAPEDVLRAAEQEALRDAF